jgi:poly-gamma-glutamate synthesis protein (capsule biosynthesis protein)
VRRETRTIAAIGVVAGLVAPAAACAATPRPGTKLTVAASGDFLIHTPVWRQAQAYAHGHGYDFAPMFRKIRPLIRGADVALCHVETPLTHGPPHTYPSFRTPVALATAIKSTGWDVCSTASNHTLDAGQSGVDSTIAALAHAGVRHTGSYRSRKASRRPTILNEARRARRAGADAVIVNLHWGNEYASAATPAQRSLADRLTRSRYVTAVVGQHVHVVQPIRWIHGKPVVFGEGNLISNQTASCCAVGAQDGLVALIDLRVFRSGVRAVRVRYLPVFVHRPDYTVVHARGSSRARTIRRAGKSKRVVPLR